jgi:hypothetical protein
MLTIGGERKFAEKCREYLSQYVPFRGRDCFVAGGFFLRFYHDLPIRDIDVYVNDGKYFETLADLYSNLGFKLISQDRTVPVEHRGKFYKFKVPDSSLEIDLIGFHEPKDTSYTGKFDYMNCMSWMNGEDHFIADLIDSKKLYFNPRCEILESTSDVRANNILLRMLKYAKLGFELEPEEVKKIYKCLLDYRKRPPRQSTVKQDNLPF